MVCINNIYYFYSLLSLLGFCNAIYNPSESTVKPAYTGQREWRSLAKNPEELNGVNTIVLMHHNYSRVYVNGRDPPPPGVLVQQRQPKNQNPSPVFDQSNLDQQNWDQTQDGSQFVEQTLAFQEKQSTSSWDQHEQTNIDGKIDQLTIGQHQHSKPSGIDGKIDHLTDQTQEKFDEHFQPQETQTVVVVHDKLAPMNTNHRIHDKLQTIEENLEPKGQRYISRKNEIDYPTNFIKPYSNMAFETCPKNVTGQIVYLWSCSQYLNCWKGRTHVQNCPAGTLFNPENLECDYDHKVNCISGPHNQKVKFEKYIESQSVNKQEYTQRNQRTNARSDLLKNICSPNYSGLLPHPNDCKKFVNCVNGQTFVQDCGPGTAFNVKIQACDWPENVDCETSDYILSEHEVRSMPKQNYQIHTQYGGEQNHYNQDGYDYRGSRQDTLSTSHQTTGTGGIGCTSGCSQQPSCTGSNCSPQYGNEQHVYNQGDYNYRGSRTDSFSTGHQSTGSGGTGCTSNCGQSNVNQQPSCTGYNCPSTGQSNVNQQYGCTGPNCPLGGQTTNQYQPNKPCSSSSTSNQECGYQPQSSNPTSSYQPIPNVYPGNVPENSNTRCDLYPDQNGCQTDSYGNTNIQHNVGTSYTVTDNNWLDEQLSNCQGSNQRNCQPTNSNTPPANIQNAGPYFKKVYNLVTNTWQFVPMSQQVSTLHVCSDSNPQNCKPNAGGSNQEQIFQKIFNTTTQTWQYVPIHSYSSSTFTNQGQRNPGDKYGAWVGRETQTQNNYQGHIPAGSQQQNIYQSSQDTRGNRGLTHIESSQQQTGGQLKKVECPKGHTGLLPHPTICKKFLNCANGRTYVQDCGPGTVFNPQTSVCDWPQNVNCATTGGTLQSHTGSQGFDTSTSTPPREIPHAPPPNFGYQPIGTHFPSSSQNYGQTTPQHPINYNQNSGQYYPSNPNSFVQTGTHSQPVNQYDDQTFGSSVSTHQYIPTQGQNRTATGRNYVGVIGYRRPNSNDQTNQNTGSSSSSCTGSYCPPSYSQFSQTNHQQQPSSCIGDHCTYPSTHLVPPAASHYGTGQTDNQPPTRSTISHANHQQQSGPNSNIPLCSGNRCTYPSTHLVPPAAPDYGSGQSDTQPTATPTASDRCIGNSCSYPNTPSGHYQSGELNNHRTTVNNRPSLQYNPSNCIGSQCVNSKLDFGGSKPTFDYPLNSNLQQGINRNNQVNDSKIFYVTPITANNPGYRPNYNFASTTPRNGERSNRRYVELPVEPLDPVQQETSINVVQNKNRKGTKHWPPPFPSTDINADYDFDDREETTTPLVPNVKPTNKPLWKSGSKCQDHEFTCKINECIPKSWVCDGNLDCTNGNDEKNCGEYIKHFTKIPYSRLYKHEVEKWLNTDLDTCAHYCLQTNSFTCKSFNFRRGENVCLLCNTNVGASGALSKSSVYDYYEISSMAVNCSGLYECSNKKCINHTQVCDGTDDCGNRQDEKNCKADQLDYAIRLAGSEARNEGRVEVKVFGQWGYICDDKFGLRSADVVCKELGFKQGALEVKQGSYFAKTIKDNETFYLMDDVQCFGNESSVRNCDFAGWGVHNCMPQEIVGVICKTEQETCPAGHWKCDTTNECLPLQFLCDGVVDCADHSDEGNQHCEAPIELRLMNGATKFEGRVEVRYHGVWGTICDDDFNDHTAKVVCQSLGYTGSAIAKKDGAFGQGDGPIWLDQVHCFGNESFIDECSHWNWNEHNCEHSEDAGVVCSNKGASDYEKKSKSKDHVNMLPEKPPVEEGYEGKCGHTGEDLFFEDNRNSDVHFRVVKGNKAKQGQYPWQATIRIKGKNIKSSHWCGAVIVSNKFVLTAAHCLVGFSKGSYIVRAGDYNIDEDEGSEVEAYIEDFFVHEKFRQGGHMNNDIALIKLKGAGLRLNKQVQPICLPNKNTIYKPGLNCTISGFGSTESGKSSSSHVLRAGWVKIQPDDVCKMEQVYGDSITAGMFCAGSLDEGVDSCDGDSGGPFACLDKGLYTLYGLTSWGQRCGHANKPGVYVKVAHYRDWIDEKIQENS